MGEKARLRLHESLKSVTDFIGHLRRHDPEVGCWLSILQNAVIGLVAIIGYYVWQQISPESSFAFFKGNLAPVLFIIFFTLAISGYWFAWRCYREYKQATRNKQQENEQHDNTKHPKSAKQSKSNSKPAIRVADQKPEDRAEIRVHDDSIIPAVTIWPQDTIWKQPHIAVIHNEIQPKNLRISTMPEGRRSHVPAHTPPSNISGEWAWFQNSNTLSKLHGFIIYYRRRTQYYPVRTPDGSSVSHIDFGLGSVVPSKIRLLLQETREIHEYIWNDDERQYRFDSCTPIDMKQIRNEQEQTQGVSNAEHQNN